MLVLRQGRDADEKQIAMNCRGPALNGKSEGLQWCANFSRQTAI